MNPVRKHDWFVFVVFIGLGLFAAAIFRPQIDLSALSRSSAASSFLESGWVMEGYRPSRDRFVPSYIDLPFTKKKTYRVGKDMAFGSPPAIGDDLLIVEVDGTLRAYALDAWRHLWSYPHKGSFLSPAVAGDVVVFRVERENKGRFVALDVDRGEERWSFEPVGVSSQATAYLGGHLTSPVIDEGAVYVASGSKVYALDLLTGEERWSRDVSDLVSSSIAIAEDTLFLTTFSSLMALDTETGELKWMNPVAQAISFSPVVSGEIVVYTNGPAVTASNVDTGDVVWDFEMDGNALVPAGVSSEFVLVKSSTTLFALDGSSGELVWQFEDANFVSLPAIARNCLFAVSGSSRVSTIVMVNPENGTGQWLSIESLARAAPVLAGGRLYAKAADGFVIELQ